MRQSNPTPKIQTKVLAVSLNETLVGTLTLLPNDQSLFAFDDSYVENQSRPTLGLSFKTVTGQLRTKLKPTRLRLPPFFSNLLPEGHLREYLAQRAGVHKDREFFLLAALKDDLPGAVRINTVESAHFIEHQSPLASRPDEHPDALRFSLAGVQLKFSAILEATGGLTIPLGGVGGDWIVKLPSARFPSVPENEFSMMQFAASVGIEVPETGLVSTNSVKNLPPELPENFGNSLRVKRFDRLEDGTRIQIEDFAQVYQLFPEEKYQKVSYRNLASLLWIETGEAGLEEFIRRLVFNIGIGNSDMHAKNWSLIYRDGRTPALSPGYDFVSTVSYLDNNSTGLSLAGARLMTEVNMDAFKRLAAKAELPENLVLSTVKDTVERMRETWPKIQSELPMPTQTAARMWSHLEAVPVMSLH
jgi:serine/threonine-protein kinase HipA